MQSVHVTTNVVSSNPAQVRCTLYKLCDKVFQSLATCQWFSPGTPVSCTNKTDRHDITGILLKVALNTTNQTKPPATCVSRNYKDIDVNEHEGLFNIKLRHTFK